MTLKLTRIQFLALYNLYLNVVLKDVALTMHDKLTLTMMVRVYQKLYKKAMENKPKYRIKLTEEEAIAFWIYWQGHTFSPSSFEGNLLTTIINSIDQKFA
jgi:hypothetical protein